MTPKVHRTPEAQADIAAARAAPTAMEIAMQEVDRAAEQALHELRNAPTAYRAHGDPPVEVTGLGHHGIPLDAALSNAAIADTPAVREMGGPARREVDDEINARAHDPRRPTDALFDGPPCVKCGQPTGRGLEAWAAIHAACTPPTMPPPGAVLLTGLEAERYHALQVAARKAQASSATARADSAALLQLFQAFCAGVAPGKDG